ncbi:MAG: phosphatidate cytidylyltransferase, partial [Clostridiales bacterium]|nr:phosphatidate cytidylyltransferase [Clostridiales bacterium]
AIFSTIAVYEIAKCARVKNQGVIGLGMAVGALFPFFTAPNALEPMVSAETLGKISDAVSGTAVLVFYTLILLLVMIRDFERTKFEQVAVVFFASLAVPFGLTTVIHFRDLYLSAPERFTKEAGIYGLFVGAICAWGTDSGAYLAGRMFGKHKMSPKISPKKTMEGAVGGIVLSVALNLGAFFLFQAITGQTPMAWYLIALVSVPVSFLGMMGDLAASVIKRNYGVKDFGKIFPGHGGVMDRFDSALFTFSALYAFLLIYISAAA